MTEFTDGLVGDGGECRTTGAADMSVVLATLMLVVATAVPATTNQTTVGAANSVVVVDPVSSPAATTLDADTTVRLAAAASDAASILDGERTALGCELNRNDDAACAQVGLIQAVLKDLAMDRREDSATDGLDSLYRLISLSQQTELLTESDRVLADLLQMANRAEELDLPDGNASDLKQQQLDVRDSQIVVRFGINKLKRRLASLIDRPLAEVETMSLLGSALSGETTLDEKQAIEIALENRGDYQAAVTLCRCMNAESLPAAKSMLGVLQPGIGFATVSGSLPLLAKLAQRDKHTTDLVCRRCQCQSLRDNTCELITDQVTQAILDVQEARARLVIADEITGFSEDRTRRQQAAEKIDKAGPGSEKLARLNQLKRQSERIERQRDVLIAEAKLRRAMGTLVRDTNRN